MALPNAEGLERSGLAAWPGIEVEWDGAWVRRSANGYTKRANSVQCLDPADDANASARILAAADWYVARGLTPVFRVTPLTGPQTLAALDGLGWRAYDHSHVFAMPLDAVAADPRGADYDAFDPAFLAVQRQLAGYGDSQMAGLTALLAALATPARGIVLSDGAGTPVASAIMTLADGIVVAGNVVTDPSQRRKGYGAAMMRTGLAWGHGADARYAMLNVQADNAGAQALYRGLGYVHQYDYHYCSPEIA
ncbi:GNAT family N-acetyltransferase [Devosia sp. FKR38]|uniref:GNAT family N-acetyltransferase n=1 Tax=Devosia sp. FKR38 TaxID=2562312 RepID=UPI001485AA52|nr:GNAT family N-acetyltransferase [Devosia sp. FKR38]